MSKFDYRNHLQNIFGCSSANFDKYPEIWMNNIELFLPQLRKFIKTDIKYNNIINFSKNDRTLCNLFNKYGSDKGCEDGYWPIYTEILEKYKNSEIRLLEIGLGTNDSNLISTMGETSKTKFRCGSSLRSFRDYLQKAEIFGADVDRNCLFSEDRIKTFYVDQLEFNSFTNLFSNCGDQKFDIIIDDGLHSITANLNTILFAINNINVNGTIIIEDILVNKLDGYIVIDNIVTSNYPKFRTEFILYKNKSGFIYKLFLEP